jgi:hypothetical protein
MGINVSLSIPNLALVSTCMVPWKGDELAMLARLPRRRCIQRAGQPVWVFRDEVLHSQIYIQRRCLGHMRLRLQAQQAEH